MSEVDYSCTKSGSSSSKNTVEVYPRQKAAGRVDFARVVVRDSGSGEIISERRVFLLAEEFAKR